MTTPPSPSEPRRGDDLARQERMAELEREIIRLSRDDQQSTIHQPWIPGTRRHDKRISELRSELSRLRNEGGGEDNVAVMPKRLPEGERYDLAMARQTLERVIVPPAEEPPSDLPAREAIESIVGTAIDAALSDCDPRPISAGQYSGCIQSVADAILSAFPALSQGNGEAPGHTDLMISPEAIDEAIEPLYAAPSSQPEGVREALEFAAQTLAEKWVYLARETSEGDFRWSNDAAVRNIRDEIKSFAQNFTTTPSRGLVKAAEWPFGHNETLRMIEAALTHSRTGIVVSVPGFEEAFKREASRTLSAKPTANAADREGDRDGA
jgi:hypothetical protein